MAAQEIYFREPDAYVACQLLARISSLVRYVGRKEARFHHRDKSLQAIHTVVEDVAC